MILAYAFRTQFIPWVQFGYDFCSQLKLVLAGGGAWQDCYTTLYKPSTVYKPSTRCSRSSRCQTYLNLAHLAPTQSGVHTFSVDYFLSVKYKSILKAKHVSYLTKQEESRSIVVWFGHVSGICSLYLQVQKYNLLFVRLHDHPPESLRPIGIFDCTFWVYNLFFLSKHHRNIHTFLKIKYCEQQFTSYNMPNILKYLPIGTKVYTIIS